MYNYFRYLYPWRLLHQLATQNGEVDFAQREIRIRYQGDNFSKNASWKDVGCFKTEVLRTHRHVASIDINAVWPDESRQKNFTTILERELTFDIDINDYDKRGVRVCGCGGDAICPLCWDMFAKPACSIMRHYLGSVCGYKQIAMFFSGRRGLHCWVFDRQTHQLTNEQRVQIITAMSLVPNLVESTMLPLLHKHILPQNIFNKKLQQYLIDNCSQQYKRLLATCLPMGWRQVEAKCKPSMYQDLLHEVAWLCFRPEFDVAPVKIKHNLKIPFSPHHKTGFINLPLEPDDNYKCIHVNNVTKDLLQPYIIRVSEIIKNKKNINF